MGTAPAKIKCSKCGAESRQIREKCPACGALLVKECGNCGFANSVPKNYCDSCGELLTLIVPKTPEPEPRKQPVQSSPAPSPQPAALSGKIEKPSVPTKTLSPKRTRAETFSLRPFFFAFSLMMGAGLLLLFIHFFLLPALPRYMLAASAKRYLKEFSSGNYARAYELLSNASKRTCSKDEFIKLSRENNPARWEFRGVKIFLADKDAAMIKYEIKEGTKPWTSDYISFVRENGKWARPYIWNMFSSIDEAMDKGDKPRALFLAQKLNLTDPMDPRTHGYLCAAEYDMGLYPEAVRSCGRALKSAGLYPVGYSVEAIAAFRYRLADSYRLSGKHKEALEAYAALAALQDLNSETLCGMRMGKAQLYLTQKDYDSALKEVLEAQNVCDSPQARTSAREYLKVMTGDAKDMAVELARNYQPAQGQPKLSEVWLQRKAGYRQSARPRQMPSEAWLAMHVRGPIYSVVLKTEGGRDRYNKPIPPANVYTLQVDIWNSTATMENVQ